MLHLLTAHKWGVSAQMHRALLWRPPPAPAAVVAPPVALLYRYHYPMWKSTYGYTPTSYGQVDMQIWPRTEYVLIIRRRIRKGHSLRRACLQLATNTQNSKPRPPTTNAKSK